MKSSMKEYQHLIGRIIIAAAIVIAEDGSHMRWSIWMEVLVQVLIRLQVRSINR